MIIRTALLASTLAFTPAVAPSEASHSADRNIVSSGGLELTLPGSVAKSAFGKRDIRVMAIQVMLDRSRHSPGVIDGYMGGNTRRAIRYYRRATGLPEGDGIDQALIESLLKTQGGDIFSSYTITEEDISRDFSQNPNGFAEMADDDRLNYESPLEMFGERFHMGQGLLEALNPRADFGKSGTQLAIVSHGNEKLDPAIARIEIRKHENTVAVLDDGGKLLASYPATIGSGEFPSPSGRMKVKAIAPEPVYYFSPEGRQWGPDKQLKIAAGPNNPVGGTWIDLSKEGYGIHGSPDPAKVSKRASHGCVRLTNWDAEELAQAAETGTPVVFV